MAKLTVRPDSVAGAAVLRLEGEIDAQNAGELERARETARSGPSSLAIVDMRAVAYVASAGWGVLLSNSRTFEREGRQVVLAGMSVELRRVFEMLHFHTVLRSAPDVESALKLAGAR